VDHRVGPGPVVDVVAPLDLIPAQREAVDLDAERAQLVQPAVERAGAGGEPGVVLDAVADVRGCLGRSRQCDQRQNRDVRVRESLNGTSLVVVSGRPKVDRRY
jgi:hypothetical protein